MDFTNASISPFSPFWKALLFIISLICINMAFICQIYCSRICNYPSSKVLFIWGWKAFRNETALSGTLQVFQVLYFIGVYNIQIVLETYAYSVNLLWRRLLLDHIQYAIALSLVAMANSIIVRTRHSYSHCIYNSYGEGTAAAIADRFLQEWVVL